MTSGSLSVFTESFCDDGAHTLQVRTVKNWTTWN